VSPEIAERLANFHIEVLAETKDYTLVGRGDFVAMIATNGSIGSTGMMTDQGFAYLIWRDGRVLLAAKGSETPAGDAQVEAIREFSEDLKKACAA
jgi:hypothetical protein